jgi:hypothetical protein
LEKTRESRPQRKARGSRKSQRSRGIITVKRFGKSISLLSLDEIVMAHSLRSTTSEKQNQHHRNHHENGSAHTNTILSSAKALRLVYCDEDGSFRMDAEAVASLQLVKGPLGVVSVCGRARQGKSFILNQVRAKTPIFSSQGPNRFVAVSP